MRHASTQGVFLVAAHLWQPRMVHGFGACRPVLIHTPIYNPTNNDISHIILGIYTFIAENRARARRRARLIQVDGRGLEAEPVRVRVDVGRAFTQLRWIGSK
jgi:hypothetical protein